MQVVDYEVTRADANTAIDVRKAFNDIFEAVKTQNSGSAEPLNTSAFMNWVDTSNETTHYMKCRNHTNTAWFTVFEYDIATKAIKMGEVYTKTEVTNLLAQLKSEIVNGSPALLDTLSELSAALGNDASFATSIATSLSGKAPTSHNHTAANITDLGTAISTAISAQKASSTVYGVAKISVSGSTLTITTT